MVTMSQPDIEPQPGAVQWVDGDYKPNGLPPDDIPGPGDWPILPALQAPNFEAYDYPKPVRIIKAEEDPDAWIIKDADDRILEASKFLWRIWGSPAYDTGRYWTDGLPDRKERLRSR
jgi:hypothetical protein